MKRGGFRETFFSNFNNVCNKQSIAETIVEKCKFSAGRENNAKNFRGCGDLTYICFAHCIAGALMSFEINCWVFSEGIFVRSETHSEENLRS